MGVPKKNINEAVMLLMKTFHVRGVVHFGFWHFCLFVSRMNDCLIHWC
jgi:hypothetical protein